MSENQDLTPHVEDVEDVEGHRVMQFGDESGVPRNHADSRRRAGLSDDDDVEGHVMGDALGIPPEKRDR